MSGVVESVGLGLSVVALIAAFKGAVDGYLLIDSFFDDDNKSSYWALRYHTEMHKLAIWGDFFKTTDPANCTLTDQPEAVKRLILRILSEIKNIHQHADKYIKKYDLTLPGLPSGDLDKSLHQDGEIVKKLAKLMLGRKQRSRIAWTIKGKEEFAEIVTQLDQLNRDLYDVLKPGETDLLYKSLSSYVLAKIKEDDLLKTIQSQDSQSPRLLALSAKLKYMHQSTTTVTASSATPVSKSCLKLSESNWTTGLYQDLTGQTHSIWVEWNAIDRAMSDYATVRSRAEALASLIETVNEPALCIPPCIGLFDDLEYETKHNEKRLGYVFKVPSEDFEDDLRRFKPVTLRELLRISRDTPPLLGDRFKLANLLASAFSLFHCAGWLHKGFNSGSIVFLHKTNGGGVSIIQPFITGFQYSRALNSNTFGVQKSKNPEVEYYYHTLIESGFTKRLDLYSLGVVLCEIGRWELLADAVPDKSKLSNRTWATKFITGDPLEDLGWRMGQQYREVARTLLTLVLPDDGDDFFAHEYFKRVLAPLDRCSA